MNEELKIKLVKKLCFPIRIATIVFSIEFLIFILKIPNMIQLTIEMYNSYNLEVPKLVKGLSNIIEVSQNNTLTGVLLSVGIIGIAVVLNVLWKYIAKKIINTSKMEIEVLAKKVNKFQIIATISISLVLIICFGVLYIGAYKALADVYTNSFIFDAYTM